MKIFLVPSLSSQKDNTIVFEYIKNKYNVRLYEIYYSKRLEMQACIDYLKNNKQNNYQEL